MLLMKYLTLVNEKQNFFGWIRENNFRYICNSLLKSKNLKLYSTENEEKVLLLNDGIEQLKTKCGKCFQQITIQFK